MTSAAELAQELTSLSAFLAARAAAPGSEDAKETVSRNMVIGFTKKVFSLKGFGAQDALLLCNVLQSSTLPVTHRETIQKAIDSRLDGSDSNMSMCRPASHTPQKLTSQLTSFLTRSDWEKLRSDRVSLSGKTQVIVDRFQRLGLRYAHEQTVKWAVAVIVLHMCQSSGVYPEYSAILSMVHDFKATMEACRKPFVHGHIVSYPSSPDGLPEAVIKHAYDADDPPITIELERLANTAENHVPLRSSSALLRTGGQRSTSSQACNASAVTWDQLRSLLSGLHGRRGSQPHQLLQLEGMAAPSAAIDPDGATSPMREEPLGRALSSPSLALLGQDSPQPKQQELMMSFQPRSRLSLMPPMMGAAATQPPVAPVPLTGLAASSDPSLELTLAPAAQSLHIDNTASSGGAAAPGVSSGIDAERYEDAALAALVAKAEKQRELKKKPASDIMKRPASASSCSEPPPKKPLAKLNKLPWSDDDAAKPRKLYTSKMYHTTKKNAINNGDTNEIAAAKAKEAYQAAGLLWDKNTA